MKGEKMRSFAVVLRLIMAVILMAILAQASIAAEIKFPTPCYEGEELAKVREWEKTWVGKKVGVNNIDQVKDFLVEPVYIIMKNWKDFGGSGEGFWFEVVPYRPYNIAKSLIDNTLKYAPEAKLNEKRYLVNYGKMAGFPFPNVKDNGDEMAWNFDSNTKGDSHKETAYPAANMDMKTKLERVAGHIRWELYWTGRSYIPPMPAVEKNPKDIRRSFYMKMTDPVDFRDTAMLEIIYNPQNKDEDLWIYMSMFRRIRRVAVKQRTDMIDGTDQIYDDQDGWYTHVTHNTYKYVGRKELLTCRHQDIKRLKHIKSEGWFNNLQRERINTYVLEVKNEEPDYVYSKQVWYLDPENWQMDVKTMYDKEGRLWKVMDMFYDEVPGYGGAKVATIIADTTTDIIRKHSGTSIRTNEFTGKPIPEGIFTVGNMQKFSY
jgi:hypothetical protein